MVNLALAPENPMNRASMSVLICQLIVVALAFPGMVIVSNVGIPLAAAATIIGMLLCLFGAARMKTPAGYLMGWGAQVVSVLMGFLTPMMFGVGGLFAVIWTVNFVLGRRLEKLPAR